MSENELTLSSAKDIIFSPNAMQQMNQLATLMSAAICTIPRHLQGNTGDCFAIALQAAQWGMNPFAVAQKTFLVSGVLGYEAQLINAVITTMAPTKGRLKFEWFGDWSKVIGNFKEVEGKNGKYRKLASTLADEKGCGVKVWATLKDENEPRVLELLLTQAGVRNSTLWADDPRQQLAYLAIKRWARLYCPDVIMGVYSPDELETITPEKVVNQSAETDQKPDVDGLLIAIKTMNIDDFKAIDPAQFTDDERLIIRHAMSARKKEIVRENKARIVEDIAEKENIDWAHSIKECGDDITLNKLLESMPESAQIEYQATIEAQFNLVG